MIPDKILETNLFKKFFGDTSSGDEEPILTITKGSLVILVGVFFGKGVSFLSKLLAARYLGPDQYGLIVLGYTVIVFSSILALMGLHKGIARNLPRFDEARRAGLIGSSTTFVFGLSTVIATSIFLSAGTLANDVFHEPALKPIIRMFAIAIPFFATMRLGVGIGQGHKDPRTRVYIQEFMEPGTRFLAILAAIFFGFATLELATAWSASIVFTGVFAALLLRKKFGLDPRNFETPLLLKTLRFSAPLMIAMWTGMLLQNTDNFLLGYFLDSQNVGVYDAAFTLSYLIFLVYGVTSYMFLPAFSELHSEGDHSGMKSTIKKASLLTVLLTLPGYLLFLAFPEQVLALLYGAGYGPGALSLQILATGLLVHTSLGLSQQALIAMGKTKTIMIGNTAAALLNIALNILLIPLLGIEGAAIASAISYGAVMIFFLMYLTKTKK